MRLIEARRRVALPILAPKSKIAAGVVASSSTEAPYATHLVMPWGPGNRANGVKSERRIFGINSLGVGS